MNSGVFSINIGYFLGSFYSLISKFKKKKKALILDESMDVNNNQASVLHF